MTLVTKQVVVKWHGNNRKHYEALGYKWTKQGDSFLVNVQDLPKGSNVKVKVKCDYCGEKYTPRWKDFLRGRSKLDRDACGDRVCRAMKANEIKILDGATTVADIPELIKEWSNENEVSPERVLARSNNKYKWVCSTCSHEWTARVMNRTNKGDGCPHCAGRYSEPLSVTHPELIEEWSEDNVKKPSEITAGSDYRAKWKCRECSHEWTAKVSNRTALGSGCPVCNESKGEKLVARIFDDLNVCYVREYSFDRLRGSGGRSLRYDFAILHEGEPIALIEYDGEQHFKAIEHFGGEDTLKRQQRHDQLKDEYARYYDVPIIRIRYDQDEEEIKGEVSEFVTKWKEFNETVRSVLIIND